MRRITALTSLLLASLFPAAMVRCTQGNAGIETTNGARVAASFTSISGTAPAFARVSLFDSAYIPGVDSGLALATPADEEGSYGFEGLAAGTYTLIVETRDNGQAAAFEQVKVGPSATGAVLSKTLEPTGAVTGSVTASGDSSSAILLYLAGTGYYVVLDRPGPFLLDGIPAGTYSLQASALAAGGTYATPRIVSDQDRKSVEVQAGEITNIKLQIPVNRTGIRGETGTIGQK